MKTNYVDANLVTGEEVVYRTSLHWFHFARLAILSIFLYPGLKQLLIGDGALAPETRAIGKVFVFLLASAWVLSYLKFKTAEFAITNMRVIIKVGVLKVKSFDINLAQVEGLSIEDGLVGRLLHFGTVRVHGAGGSHELFPNISNAAAFRRVMTREAAKAQAHRAA